MAVEVTRNNIKLKENLDNYFSSVDSSSSESWKYGKRPGKHT